MTQPWRKIVEEKTFEEDKAKLAHDARRLDEILDGVVELLSREPERGKPMPDSDLLVVVTQAYPDAPSLGVTYRFDDETTYLLAVELD
jgi:hypothetical protein